MSRYGVFETWPDASESTRLIFDSVEAAKMLVDAALRDVGIKDYRVASFPDAAHFTRHDRGERAMGERHTLYWILPVDANGRCDVG